MSNSTPAQTVEAQLLQAEAAREEAPDAASQDPLQAFIERERVLAPSRAAAANERGRPRCHRSASGAHDSISRPCRLAERIPGAASLPNASGAGHGLYGGQRKPLTTAVVHRPANVRWRGFLLYVDDIRVGP